MTTRKKTNKKPASKDRRRGPARKSTGLRVGLAVLFLGAFLLGSLVFLAQMRERYRPVSPAPGAGLLLEDVQVELESALLRTGVSLRNLQTRRIGEITELTLAAEFPEQQTLEGLRRRLSRLSGDLELRIDRAGHRVEVLLAGTPRYLLSFSSLPDRSPAPAGARVAIIMDDLGRDMHTVRSLLELDIPVTLSILPNTRHAAEAATLAHRYRREVMIHIPMEPLGYPATNPGENALLVKLTQEEIRSRFLSYLEKIPYAVGGNNHMGSRFTANAEKMRPVLELMHREGLFFIDSRTTSLSVAAAEARAAGVAVASRDMFLDNEHDVERIAAQIRKLALSAARNGAAIGICHPHPQTLEALRREGKFLQDQGVQVVPASKLIRD